MTRRVHLESWARERGEAAPSADLDTLAQASGPGFVRGDLRSVFG